MSKAGDTRSDKFSWMEHVVCEVGSENLDATLGDTQYDFSS